jgi:FKBP-type peptidyl-prolyl cis-trans isomerase FkpA
MKTVYYSVLMAAFLAILASCNQTSYHKTKSGMLYKIIHADNKDSVVKAGNWMKIHFMQLRNDSVLQTSYDKMPIYQQMIIDPTAIYNPVEVFPLLKKGDSVITIQLIDSLISKNMVTVDRLPPYLKKGDKIVFKLKILDVFRNDSLYRLDAEAEYAKDKVRQDKEGASQKVKELQEMEQYLATKKIPAQKFGEGTFVWIKQQGTGPQADSGKFITVKYTGRLLTTDSVFESNVYPLQLGVDPVIAGWQQGLKAFKEGGKGTLYVPGHMAYGKNPPPGSPFGPNAALIFDVEMIRVADKPEAPPPPPPTPKP